MRPTSPNFRPSKATSLKKFCKVFQTFECIVHLPHMFSFRNCNKHAFHIFIHYITTLDAFPWKVMPTSLDLHPFCEFPYVFLKEIWWSFFLSHPNCAIFTKVFLKEVWPNSPYFIHYAIFQKIKTFYTNWFFLKSNNA